MRLLRVTTIITALAACIFILLSATLVYHYFFEKSRENNPEHEHSNELLNFAESFLWNIQENMISENISLVLSDPITNSSASDSLMFTTDENEEQNSSLPTHNRHKKRYSNSLRSLNNDQDTIVLNPTSISEQQIMFDLPDPTESVFATTTTTTQKTRRKKIRQQSGAQRHNRLRNKTKEELTAEILKSMKHDTIRCGVPRPKVVKVQEVHPHAYKRFVPSCIILHRCERDTGCCDDAYSVCSPLRKRRITKHFYVVRLSVTDGVPAVQSSGTIDALRFVNHTECACKRRKPFLPAPRDMGRVSGATTAATTRLNTQTFIFFIGLVLFRLVLR